MKLNQLLFGAVLAATSASAVDFRPLTEQCEEALALSALPSDLRERASVYIWRNGDYVLTTASDGGFHCLVQRNHRDAIIPECVSESGKDSILQGIMAQTRMTAEGMDAEAVARRTEELIERGDIGSPKGPGVNYMMSAFNRIYAAGSDRVLDIGPHAMYFAPGATNAALGGNFETARETKGFPFVAEAGTHSYIITFTEHSSDSSDVEAACSGQYPLAGDD